MKTIERNILKRIANSFNREKDERNPNDLPFEIQFELGCGWGRALSLANYIRTKNYRI